MPSSKRPGHTGRVSALQKPTRNVKFVLIPEEPEYLVADKYVGVTSSSSTSYITNTEA